ncbi:MAG: 3-dehydroquinate synthase [Verrucomicrobia bacterium]|nr:3-dehydroquinate synthase [Verrucomicrobiota bacterium]
MSQSVHVELGDRSYEIHIGRDLSWEVVPGMRDGRRALLVTDNQVDNLYGDACAAKLQAHGLDVSRIAIPAGEASKNLDCTRQIYDAAITAGLDRHAILIALGGGVVGDLGGFAAATYLRGIDFVQVPTSLLAMVDSSVGGKTGVNLPQGKNLIGAFYQPVAVLADLATLASLPDREYISGLAEVIKYGVIWDAQLFATLEAHGDQLRSRDMALLEAVVARCCEIKAEVVAVDERDAGVRAILNFGHTLGHAIEQVSGYGQWLHGEAIAMGMAYAARLSSIEKGFDDGAAGRLIRLLEQVGLPTQLDPATIPGGWAALREAIATDKKTRSRIPRFVLAEKLGGVVYDCAVAEETLASTYASWTAT